MRQLTNSRMYFLAIYFIFQNMLFSWTILVCYLLNHVKLSLSILRIHRGKIINTGHVQSYSNETLLGCTSRCRKSMFCAGANFLDDRQCLILDRLSVDRTDMTKDLTSTVIIFVPKYTKNVSL